MVRLRNGGNFHRTHLHFYVFLFAGGFCLIDGADSFLNGGMG